MQQPAHCRVNSSTSALSYGTPLAPSLPLRRDSLRFLTHGIPQAVGFEDLHPAAEAQHPADKFSTVGNATLKPPSHRTRRNAQLDYTDATSRNNMIAPLRRAVRSYRASAVTRTASDSVSATA